jgi:hypothetical protein
MKARRVTIRAMKHGLAGNEEVMLQSDKTGHRNVFRWRLFAALGCGLCAFIPARPGFQFVRWSFLFFLAVLVVTELSYLLLPGYRLTMTDEGFCIGFLFWNRKLISWREVSGFGVAAYHGRHFVVYDRRSDIAIRRLNRWLMGASDALPGSYGMGDGELADILNARRESAIGFVQPIGSLDKRTAAAREGTFVNYMLAALGVICLAGFGAYLYVTR